MGFRKPVDKVNHIPLVHSLLFADERGTMKCLAMADGKDLMVQELVDVDEGNPKIIKRSIPKQHTNTVEDLMLPWATGTMGVEEVVVEGPPIPAWDKWNLGPLASSA